MTDNLHRGMWINGVSTDSLMLILCVGCRLRPSVDGDVVVIVVVGHTATSSSGEDVVTSSSYCDDSCIGHQVISCIDVETGR